MPTHDEKRHGIDWPALHRRLADLGALLDDRHRAEPRARRTVLRARARSLAAAPVPDAAPASLLQVVVFRAGAERYALEMRHVREVRPLTALTAVPGTPDYIVGVVNLSGRAVAVTDLKRLFGIPDRSLPSLNRVIVLGNDAMEAGLLADTITGVTAVEQDSLIADIPTLEGVRREFLLGVTPERIIVLDGANLLGSPRLRAHGEAPA